MEKQQKLDLIAKMIEEFSDTPEIADFLTGIADRLKKPPDGNESDEPETEKTIVDKVREYIGVRQRPDRLVMSARLRESLKREIEKDTHKHKISFPEYACDYFMGIPVFLYGEAADSECVYLHIPDFESEERLTVQAAGEENGETIREKIGRAINFPAESYDVEILWECSSQATCLRERIREGELKLVNDETGTGKIVSAAPPLERADVAKERWELKPDTMGHLRVMYAGKIIAGMVDSTQAQNDVVVTAPELLEKLAAVAKGAGVIDVGGEDVTILVPGLLLGINEVIRKARGN